jgi:vancomycin resistance protein YoaR
VLIAALGMAALIAVVVAVRLITAPADRIPRGVSVGGVAVGGLRADEAVRALRASAVPPGGAIVLDLAGEPGFPREVPVAELAPVPRARAAVEEALTRPSLTGRILAELGLPRERSVPLDFRAAPARARAATAHVVTLIDTPGRPASLRVRAGGVVATPARAGRAVEATRLTALISALPARVTVPIGPVDPAVSDAQAEAARARAEAMVATPARVRGAGREATISRERLLAALRFTPAADGIEVTLAPDALADAVRPSFEGILRPARPAGFAVEGPRVRVIPSRDGRRLDAAALARRLERRVGDGVVAVPIVAEAPARTTRQAKALGIRERVSTFTTPHACCQPRVTNIRRAAQILDGTIIPAGATFSLNEALGERTRARGFVPAPQINAGELEDAVGGGVSQMGTTTFNAAFFAGLRLVVHTPHEFWITRYPPGREATISWGGPEMIVENDWPAAILMRVTDTGTALTVSMYSSTLGRRVTTTSRGDPVEGTAFTVTVTREVYRGSTLRHDDTLRWSYEEPPADE